MLLLLFVTTSCDKEQNSRMDDFYLDFATVEKNTDKTYFVLDNYRTLVPRVEPSKQWSEGQRVGINYTPLSGDTIKVNSVSEIYTRQIKKTNGKDEIQTDPIKIQSVWVGGDHLNIIFNVEYFDTSHSMELIHDTNDDSEIMLYLSYSRNNDSPGYSQKMYASFYLGDIQSDDGEYTPFKLHMNSTSGFRIYNFKVSSKRRDKSQ